MNWFWILVGIAVLGVMVLVHEWGHFLVAKLFRVRVLVFSIGFGPRLLGVKRGPTDYRLSAVPLGGYVRMAGDNPAEERTGAPDEFLSQPRWQRALIVLAGPITNLVLAVLLLTGLFAYRYERPAFLDEPAVIGGVRPGSPAAILGLRPGDRISRFAGLENPTWEEVLMETVIAPRGPVSGELERERERLPFAITLTRELQDQPWEAGWVPESRIIVERVLPGGPAAQAGLQPGDILLALDQEPLQPQGTQDNPLAEKLQAAGGRPVVLTLEREGVTRKVTATPVYGDHPEGKRWLLELQVSIGPPLTRQELGLGEAFQKAVVQNLQDTRRMLVLLGRLMTGRASLRGLQGPVGIVQRSGEVGEEGGLPAVVNLMVLISLSLGILNLLPIPILDGGHLAVLGVEALRQRDLSLRVKERLTQVGLVFLLLVFAVVMYNDILRILLN